MVIQESLHTFETASLLGQLTNPSQVFNKINLNPLRSSLCVSSPSAIYYKINPNPVR